jgi:hypothetical protein
MRGGQAAKARLGLRIGLQQFKHEGKVLAQRHGEAKAQS